MPEAYDVHDARYIQYRALTSAANALRLPSPAVPAGKVWTMLNTSYLPSVAETRTVFFTIYGGGYGHSISRPVTIALSPTIFMPMMTEGMEIKLYPGEYVEAWRDVATAGSTMTIVLRYIETDLPYYSYVEPLKKVIRPSPRRGSSFQNVIASAGVNGSGGGEIPGGGGGGGGEPQPY